MFRIKAFADYKVIKIEKGWSGDQKYLLEKGQEKLLLKMADMSQYKQKHHEFETFKKLELLDISTSQAVDFGLDDDKKNVWMALTWVEGQDLREEIQNFSEMEQYKFGIEAGKILQKIHGLEIPEQKDCWEVRFNKKIDSKLKMYANCELKIPGGEAFITP